MPVSFDPTPPEEELNERLKLCRGDSESVNELYEFGKILMKEARDRVSRVEAKAQSFAVYGTGVVTLLVSSAGLWSKLGNQHTLWIAFCAGFCALMCTALSIKALVLHRYDYPSQDDWLNRECLKNPALLKPFRIKMMAQLIRSLDLAQRKKALLISQSPEWLRGASTCMVFLLFHISIVRSPLNKLFWHGIEGHIRIRFREYFDLGDLLCLLALGTIIIPLIRNNWHGTGSVVRWLLGIHADDSTACSSEIK